MRIWPGHDSVPPLKMTTNEQASLCIARQDFEDDSEPISGSQCPLLENNHCLCYEARPLMCRMMFSVTPCDETGQAEAPPRLLSLNIACLQLMEHIDKEGWSGYLIHLAPHYNAEDFINADEIGGGRPMDSKLRPNRPNPGFLIPPEDRAQVKSWLEKLGGPQSWK
jgi:Fe-S-cluster containining protein